MPRWNFPFSPCGRRWLASSDARWMRGLSPRREPLIRRFAPPSPTRGEGKKQRVVRKRAPASIPRLERAAGAAAGLLLDLGRVERAVELREAFGHRSGGAVGGNAGHGFRGKDFAGPPSGDGLLGALEGQFAGARGDVDIADPADDLVRGDRNLLGVAHAALPDEERRDGFAL